MDQPSSTSRFFNKNRGAEILPKLTQPKQEWHVCIAYYNTSLSIAKWQAKAKFHARMETSVCHK